MRTPSIFILILLVASQAPAQVVQPTAPSAPNVSLPAPEVPISTIENLVDTSTGAIKDGSLVTDKTFNHFVAKHQAYYLSGVNNLSFFKNFAIADVTDGVVQVGHNFAHSNDEDLISGLFTIAVQANVAKGIASLFSKGEFENELGIPFSHTFFVVKATKSGIDKIDKDELNKRRVLQYTLLKKKVNIDLQSINQAGAANPAIGAAEIDNAKSDLLKKAESDFYTNELDLFEKEYPSFRTAWVRFQGFIPITRTTYQIAPYNSLNFQKEGIHKWSAGINLGGVLENTWNWGSLFVNILGRASYTNAIEQKAEQIKVYTQYDLFNSQPPANQLYYNGDGTKVYIGDLGKELIIPMQCQLVYLFPARGETKFGIDIQFERNYYHYTKSNILFGIPLILKGKEDKAVNIEAQFKWRDVDKKDIAGSDRFTIGMSVALPFGSIAK